MSLDKQLVFTKPSQELASKQQICWKASWIFSNPSRQIHQTSIVGNQMRKITGRIFAALMFTVIPVSAKTWYVSSSSTSPMNETGSFDAPFRRLDGSLRNFSSAEGDTVLLKSGDKWYNQTIQLSSSGSKLKPLVISSYGSGAQPQIIGLQASEDAALIFIGNSHGTTIIDNIKFSDNPKMGIRLTFLKEPDNGNIVIRNCTFENMESGIGYGYGYYTPKDSSHVKNVQVDHCLFSSLIKGGLLFYPGKTGSTGISVENLNISNSTFDRCGLYSIQLNAVKYGSATNNTITQSGDTSQIGSASIYLASVSDYILDGNRIHNSIREDKNPDGCGIDFETNNRRIIAQNNIINNGHGPAIFMYWSSDAIDDSVHENSDITITRNVFYNNNQNPSIGKSEYNAEILIAGNHQGAQITNNSAYLRYDYSSSKISERLYCLMQNGSCASVPLATMTISGNRQGVLYFDYAAMDISFEPNFYASTYLDLYNAFGYNTNALNSHWNSFGVREGRIASPIFDAEFYYIAHPDLQINIGKNYFALRNHFLNSGINETPGRISSEIFDVSYYKNTYPDIATMSNTDACKHFLTLGILEGRTGSRFFSVKRYVEKYADLQSAFGVDYRSALSHYYRNGKSEGRLAPP